MATWTEIAKDGAIAAVVGVVLARSGIAAQVMNVARGPLGGMVGDSTLSVFTICFLSQMGYAAVKSYLPF